MLVKCGIRASVCVGMREFVPDDGDDDDGGGDCERGLVAQRREAETGEERETRNETRNRNRDTESS